MGPTKLYKVTGGIKGNTTVFHTDVGKLTARGLLKYSNLKSTASLLRRYREHGPDLRLILFGPPNQKRAVVITMTTSICPVCGDEFPHPATQRRVCCSRDCSLDMARGADQGNEEWQALGKRPRNRNLAKIATGTLEMSVSA